MRVVLAQLGPNLVGKLRRYRPHAYGTLAVGCKECKSAYHLYEDTALHPGQAPRAIDHEKS
jgi:hypothetical protein